MLYRCENCDYQTTKWMGFCPQCRDASGLSEAPEAWPGVRPVPVTNVVTDVPRRLSAGVSEVDRVLGGGLVPGSTILVGGEPGVGKSTLLLQIAAGVAARGGTALVVTAEESVEQVALRARRLGISQAGVYVIAERSVGAAIRAALELSPELVVIDSIQTVAADPSTLPGSVAQLRESAADLARFAKERRVAIAMVGHVTKDGDIAGPKLLEHVVDVVLHLEGDRDLGFRLLRGLKNRYGPTHRVGMFEMGETGLTELDDPSQALLGQWRGDVAGTVVFPAVDGKRPMLVEIQALVSGTKSPQPRRSVRGVDPRRVHQLLAVLERHAKLPFARSDVYVGAVGGVRVQEPAGDLAVALALASSLLGVPLGPLAAWGEVGLTGEVRPVPLEGRRAEEARRMGIPSAVFPRAGRVDRIAAALTSAGLGRKGAGSETPS